MERFLEYWQACKQQEILHALTAAQIIEIAHSISRQECNAAKISDPQILQQLGTGLVGVVPLHASRSEQYFIPCILLAELDQDGVLTPLTHLSLPIIPHAVLEPASLCPITLGAAQIFSDHLAVNPPEWQDAESAPTWQQQVNYALSMLLEVNTHWQNDLERLHYTIHDQVLIFAVDPITQATCAKLQNLNLEICDNPNSITLIDAPPNSLQSAHAKRMIITAWIEAALKQSEPPLYVWLQPQQTATYATIFSCFGAHPIAIQYEDVHPQLLNTYDIYLQGKQIVRNCLEINKRILEKYQDKGGIQVRLTHLHANLKEAKAQLRHLEVLTSIWQRQTELLVRWTKVFDFVPAMQKNRLARLHAFFKQNFPYDNVAGFTELQFRELLDYKQKRAETSLRMIADALHQVENDQHQAQIIHDRCMQWAESHDIKLATLTQIQDYIENALWRKIAELALSYWQQDFTAKLGYNNFVSKEPEKIDHLIIQSAQYIAPMQSMPLLANAKHATVMGNYSVITIPRFAVSIDFELAKYFNLAENDTDFEELQFDGYLGSIGNTWNMLTQGVEAEQILPTQNKNLKYEFIDVAFNSQAYCGSLINQGSVDVTIEWLHKNPTLAADLIIYTCFSAQAQILGAALASTAFAQVPIKLLQAANFTAAKISIFLPVYAVPDRAPYVFDQGAEMFEQLQANTLERLIVIGDKRLFKPELHSASGNFAKLFTVKNYNENPILVEVDGV